MMEPTDPPSTDAPPAKIALDDATKEQVARVLMEHGTPEQIRESLEYAGVIQSDAPPPAQEVVPIGMTPQEKAVHDYLGPLPTVEEMCASVGIPTELIEASTPPQEPSLCETLRAKALMTWRHEGISNAWNLAASIAEPYEQEAAALRLRLETVEAALRAAVDKIRGNSSCSFVEIVAIAELALKTDGQQPAPGGGSEAGGGGGS